MRCGSDGAGLAGLFARPVTERVRRKVGRRTLSTSYVERQNLTNAFSRKQQNHVHAISLHFMFYNFCKIHKTLRVTPAMEAGISDHVWDLGEVVMMADTNA